MFVFAIALAALAAALVAARTERRRLPVLALGALALAALLLVALRGVGPGGGEQAEPEPTPFFLAPLDATTVSTPVQLRMGAEGGGGWHFHVTVDAPCVPAGATIPADPTHHHFSAGQTEAELHLAPGVHSLCLQVGDGGHRAGLRSDRITVAVRPEHEPRAGSGATGRA